MNKPMTVDEYLAQEMEAPEFCAEWETLEPMHEIMEAIVERKPLTDYTLEQIADAVGVSLAEACAMQESSRANAEGIHRKDGV